MGLETRGSTFDAQRRKLRVERREFGVGEGKDFGKFVLSKETFRRQENRKQESVVLLKT